MIELKQTNRGFDYGKFTDRYGEKCSIQKSSLATEDAIWLGIDNPDVKVFIPSHDEPWKKAHSVIRDNYIITLNGPPFDENNKPLPTVSISSRMHLTREMVEQLLPILQRFVETGELS